MDDAGIGRLSVAMELPPPSRGRPIASDLLDRAEAALRRAGELNADWFWLRHALFMDRAERLSRAAERKVLAAHRLGRLAQ